MDRNMVQEPFQGKPYQPQEDIYFGDGREIELLHFVYTHPRLYKMRGNPKEVLAAIDEYGMTKKYLMNVGKHKSAIVIDLINKEKPRVMVELGGYVGYSAIAFAAALKDAGGGQYFSLERNPEFAAVMTMLVDLAGLSDIVTVVVGSSSDALRLMHRESTLKHIDLLFLDHYKPAYTPDLKLCEELGLVGPGSVYAADNVVKPGNPPYLEYVRSTVEQKRLNIPNVEPHEPQGNPDLVYVSQLVEGWEPSGVRDAVEITRCVAIQS